MTQFEFGVLALLLVMIFFVGIIVGIMLVVAKRLRVMRQPPVVIDLTPQIQQLQAAVEHHADVSAVVAMVRQLDALDENALTLIKSYPETVRAAAWLHYINTLGADLQHAQQQLSAAHQMYRRADSINVEAAQAHVDSIRDKLDRAVELSGQTGLRVV